MQVHCPSASFRQRKMILIWDVSQCPTQPMDPSSSKVPAAGLMHTQPQPLSTAAGVQIAKALLSSLQGTFGCQSVSEMLRFYTDEVLPRAMQTSTSHQQSMGDLGNMLLGLKATMRRCVSGLCTARSPWGREMGPGVGGGGSEQFKQAKPHWGGISPCPSLCLIIRAIGRMFRALFEAV